MPKRKTRETTKQEKMKKTAQRQLKVAKRKFAAAEHKIGATIKKNPEKATMIAAGLGAAIGATLAAALRRGKKKS